MEALRHYLHDPRIKGIDTDSSQLLDAHREILLKKPMMRNVFKTFYHKLIVARELYFTAKGSEVELGAGISLFKRYRPEVITSDLKSTPHCDRIIDAQGMDLEDKSIAAIYGINCFHHFPEPRKFFSELERVLKPGGGALLIEPYYGPFATKLYSNVHDYEHFNKKQKNWETDGLGAMSGANQALSYLVFERDREMFLEEFPQLEIVRIDRFNNYLEYLVSGGLNFKQLAPTWMTPVLHMMQAVFKPINHLFSLHQLIVIRKKVD